MPDPQAGVSLFWMSHYEGDNSSFRERIVASGDGWALYESLWDDGLDDETGPDDYFVLFGGIDYRSCADDEMPSEADREAIAALTPYIEGAEASLESMSGSPTIRVGAAVDFFLMGETVAAREIVIDYPEDTEDKTDEALTVLESHPYTIKIDWGENSLDRVMLIATSAEPVETPDAGVLGSCAALLN